MESLGEFEYSLADVLGHGSYAMVFRGKRKSDGLQVAIKKIPLKSVPGKLSNIRQEEISILKDLKNRHIVQLYDYLDKGSDIFLVMEYCNGGDMGDYLADKKTLSESSIRHLIKHMALALEALFKLKIIHRDIKPQNLLLSYPLSSPQSSTTHYATPVNKRPLTEAVIKLADFGFARHLYGADMAATLCGSPLYMAPEILVGQRYDNSADLWSVGVILYQCLSGSAPFLASDPHALRKRYKRENLVPKIPAGTSHYLSDLLLGLLKKRPAERLSYNDFFHHSFLKDPSTFFPADSMISQHTKSSPVPIRRKTNPAASAFSNSPSPKHSTSPHRSSSVDTSHYSSPSYSSGPPLSHRIGSQASLTYYSTTQSPSSFTDVTDQGFILVDFPGNPGSRPCSVSSSGGQSLGRNSVAGNPHSNSSASAGGPNGSLSRYSSLTTPFYQAPTTSRQNQQQAQKGTSEATPKTAFSPHGTSQSPGSIPSLISRPSPPNSVPFGKLIRYSGNSPMANISNLPGSGSVCVNPQASQFSTPSCSVTSHGSSQVNLGSKGVMSRQNSVTKLSALTEELGHSRPVRKKGDNEQGSPEKNVSCGFDIITKSCLLDSEEDIDSLSVAEEENFPLGLNMSFTEFEDEDGESSKVGSSNTSDHPVNISDQRQYSHAGRGLSGYQQPSYVQAPQSEVMQTNVLMDQPASGGRRNSAGRSAGRPRRAASFSSRSNQHYQDSGVGHPRTSSATSKDDSMKQGFLSPMLGPSTVQEEEIVSMKVPFAFSGSSSNQGSLSSSKNTAYLQGKGDHFSGPHTTIGSIQGSSMLHGGTGDAAGSDRGCCVHLGSLTLAEIRDMLELAQELQAMAKARQGPILLMSTSTSLCESGVMSRFRRCSEQLVLYAKAISLLDSISTRYGLELALAGHEEPSEEITSMIDKVNTLKAACLDSAKDVREELLSGKENGRNCEVRISAERLLYMEALDMGKAALLDEKSGELTECVKRYRRAKLILQHLIADAHTPRDKQILHKYLLSTQMRLSRVLAQMKVI